MVVIENILNVFCMFRRLSSVFSRRPEMTDNDCINFVSYSDEVYACSETNSIWRIDPQTLESIQKVNIMDMAVLIFFLNRIFDILDFYYVWHLEI